MSKRKRYTIPEIEEEDSDLLSDPESSGSEELEFQSSLKKRKNGKQNCSSSASSVNGKQSNKPGNGSRNTVSSLDVTPSRPHHE